MKKDVTTKKTPARSRRLRQRRPEETSRGRGLGTRAIHGHGAPMPGPLAAPIVQTSTFVFGSAADMRRYLEGDGELFLHPGLFDILLEKLCILESNSALIGYCLQEIEVLQSEHFA